MSICRNEECCVELVVGENWAEYLERYDHYICTNCYNLRRREVAGGSPLLKRKQLKNETKYCHRPECGVELVLDQNWSSACKAHFSYICRACSQMSANTAFGRMVERDPILVCRKAMLKGSRRRAKDYGLPFNLTLEDIIVPETCPLLDIALVRNIGGIKGGGANSPSLDRIVPALGYVKGNVWVISHKANTVKSNATVAELKLVAQGYEARLIYQHYISVPSWAGL